MKKKKYEESNDKSRTAIHSQNGIRAGVTVFLLTLLAACGADDNTPDMPQGDIPLDFGVSVDQAVSRAAETTASSLSSMGVYAYYTGSSNLSTSDKPNFMCNQRWSEPTVHLPGRTHP